MRRLGCIAVLVLTACQGAPATQDIAPEPEDGSTSTVDPGTTHDPSTTEDPSSTGDETTSSSSDESSSASSESGEPTVCGDGVIDAGEECDDGDANGRHRCSPACTVNVCGDGYHYALEEQCDEGDANGNGTSSCTADCTPNECGDGYLHDSEECDAGEDIGDPSSGCSSLCTLNVCGDGYLHDSEQCDDGDDNDADGCPTTCVDASCGDGFVQAGVEECDGDPSCTPACAPNVCGDGYVIDSESCDDGEATGDGVSVCGPACALNECGDAYWLAADEQCDPGPPSVTCQDCESNSVPLIDLTRGYSTTCVVFEPGAARCWGVMWPVVYADSQTRAADIPDIAFDEAVVQISAGEYHVCALMASGDVRCWGRGEGGVLGYGNVEHLGDDEPIASVGSIDLGGSVTRIVAAAWHSCALLEGGELRCWGYGNYGNLGYGNLHNVGDDETPASVGSVDVGATVIQVGAGSAHTCALLDTGAVRCWGDSTYGQLGYGNTETIGDDETPSSAGDVDVGGVVVQLAVGPSHTCAVLEGGRVRCWGNGSYGRLGYASEDHVGDDETPAAMGDVEVGGTVVSMDASHQTCAVLDTHALRCWGFGGMGELGYDQICDPFCHFLDVGDNETPASMGDVPIDGDFGVERVALGDHVTCAVLDTGALRCWGGSMALGYGPGSDAIGATADLPL